LTIFVLACRLAVDLEAVLLLTRDFLVIAMVLIS
jgi:hypothetical protein